MHKIKTILLVYFLLTCGFTDDKKNQIEISSETMEWKREDNIAIALGNAQAIQGDRVLNAEKIIVYFKKKKNVNTIFKLDASGKVNFVNGEQSARGDQATFLIDNETIIIKGNVKLKRQDSFMVGEKLSIDLKNNSTKLTSSKEAGKVRAKYSTEEE